MEAGKSFVRPAQLDERPTFVHHRDGLIRRQVGIILLACQLPVYRDGGGVTIHRLRIPAKIAQGRAFVSKRPSCA